MTVYTVAGHPLNITDATGSGPNTEPLRVALQENGLGKTINVTLTGPEDTKTKGHGALK